MPIEVLNPTCESNPSPFNCAPRLKTLEGATVGFISNGKEGTEGFFRHLEEYIKTEYKVSTIVWETKSNYSAPADTDIIERAQAWDLAITGLGD